MRSELSFSKKSFVLKKIEKVGHPPDIFHMKRTSISWKTSRYYGYHKTPSLFPPKKSRGKNGQRNQKGSIICINKENRGEKMHIYSLLTILFLDKKQHWSFCIMKDSKIWLKGRMNHPHGSHNICIRFLCFCKIQPLHGSLSGE